MKVISLGLAVMLCHMSVLSFAQGHHLRNEHKRDVRMGIMEYSEYLDLTTTQKAAIWDENVAFVKKMKEAQSEDASKRMDIIKAEKEAHKDRVNTILTEDQQNILSSLEETKKEERQILKAEQKQAHMAMREEIDSYREKNILPVMLPLRREFENVLTPEERGVISQLQAKRDKKMAQHKGLTKESVRDKRAARDKSPSGSNDFKSELKQIIENHRTELEIIWADTKEQRKEWELDLARIRDQIGIDAQYKSMRKRAGKKGNRNDQLKQWAHFLMMDIE